MTKVRLVLVALALAIAVPVVLLVHRAVRSVTFERELGHRAVAERVFDEMERALSTFLQREEARPFEAYADAEPPAPFALGYFQIGPDGAVSAPRARGQSPQDFSRVAGARVGAADSRRRDGAQAEQLPGTTVGIAGEARAKRAAPALKDEGESSAYEVLGSLNKGATQRAERKAKVAAKSAAEPVGQGGAKLDAAERDDAFSALGRAPAPAAPSVDAQELEQELPPMMGRALEDGRLLLSRTVVRGGRAYRQGMVLDVGALEAFLRAQALGPPLGAQATLAVGTAQPAMPAGDYVYQHRFADPFDDLSARLALRTLPGTGDAWITCTCCRRRCSWRRSSGCWRFTAWWRWPSRSPSGGATSPRPCRTSSRPR